MKYFKKTLGLVIFLLIILIINNLNAQVPHFPENCIGYWPFNETDEANDLSGNGYDGTIYGATLTTGKDVNSQSAYHFSQNRIDISSNFGANLTNTYTISIWIKPNGNQFESGCIISKGDTEGTVCFRFLLGTNNGLNIYQLTESGYASLNSTSLLQPSKWNHVVASYDGNNLNIYINGQLDSQVNMSGNLINLSGKVNIGAYMNFNPNRHLYLSADIDEIAIYNRMLTDCEVKTIHLGYNPCCVSWVCSENKLTFNTGQNGQVLINTDELDSDFHLGVKGKIKTEEVLVTLTDWPDYVFKNNYKLKPLNQLENFIKINNHLPNVPSEKEVKEEGVSLGEMNAKLLEKIEELTLYLIEQNKDIQMLKKDNIELRQEINELKKQE